LRALRESPEAFGSTLDRELGYSDALLDERALAASSGSKAATFVVDASDGESTGDWLALVTVLGPTHEGVMRPARAELVSMWICPSHRRKGLATQLVEVALKYASAIAADTISLSVTRGNRAALALYEGHGFVQYHDRDLPAEHPCSGDLRLRLVLGQNDLPDQMR
jgi:ribosomal protein S18 acetylase RimI-like enzyme